MQRPRVRSSPRPPTFTRARFPLPASRFPLPASRFPFDSSLTQCKIGHMTTSRTAPRLSGKEALILDLLVHRGELYGLQLVAASRGRLKRGTIYVTLGRMEKKGYVRSRAEGARDRAGGLPRRLYKTTPYGLRVMKAWSMLLQHLSPEPAR